MKGIASILLLGTIFLGFTSFVSNSGWVQLLDKDLSKWEMYQSFRHRVGYHGEAPVDEKGQLIKPIGYNKNEAGFVSVNFINNEPVIRISGETYGCVFTKQVYQNYDLRLMVKFGDKKWPPRINEPKDSGLLYHSHGEAGTDYWRSFATGYLSFAAAGIFAAGVCFFWPSMIGFISEILPKNRSFGNVIDGRYGIAFYLINITCFWYGV